MDFNNRKVSIYSYLSEQGLTVQVYAGILFWEHFLHVFEIKSAELLIYFSIAKHW